MILRMLTFSIFLSAAGCAATGTAVSGESEQEAKEFKISHGGSAIYIYREKQFIGSGAPAVVWLDYQKVGLLGPGEFLTAEVPPGRHLIFVEDGQCTKPGAATKAICDVMPGVVILSFAVPGPPIMGVPRMQPIVGSVRTKANEVSFIKLSLSFEGGAFPLHLSENSSNAGRELVFAARMVAWSPFGTLLSEQNFDERRYETMVEKGHVAAAYRLGLYKARQGDSQAAWRWMCRAADQGVALAQLWVGAQYSGPNGLREPDMSRSHMWFSLAERLGPDWIVSLREQLERDMAPDDIAKARTLVTQWEPGGCES